MLAAAVIVSLHTTPMYRAEGQITINKENPNPLGFKDDAEAGGGDYNANIELATQVTVLNSVSLALQAIRQLPPGEEPKAATSKATNVNASTPLTGPPQLTEEQKAQLVGTFKHDLAVAAIPGTRIIQITYMSPNPRAAADTVNGLISAYIEQNLKTRFEATTQAAEWLTKQLSDLQLKVEISEEKLVRYQKEHGIVGTDEKQNIITSKLEDLNKQLTDAEADRIQKQAIYQLTLSGDPEAVSTVSQDRLLQSLRAKQAELKNELAQADVQLGSAYPKVVELKSRIAQLDETIDAELKKTISRIHNDYVREDAVIASARQQLLPKLSASVAASYAQNDLLASTPLLANNGHTWSGTASLQQQVGQHFNFQLGYTRLREDYSSVAVLAATPDTNREFVSISYQFARPLGR